MTQDWENNGGEDGGTHGGEDGGNWNSRSERFKRVVHSMEKPRKGFRGNIGGGITNEEKRRRALAVTQLVRVGLSLEQIVDFLPTWGIKIDYDQVDAYYKRAKLTPAERRYYEKYKKAERNQDPHDFYCNRTLVRIATDSPYPIHEIELNKPPFTGARFRPDLKFRIQGFLRYGEVQLEPLPEARWRPKLLNYVKLYEQGEKFKVMFFVKQGDLTRIREHARRVLKERGHGGKSPPPNLFLFIRTSELNSSSNLVTDRAWQIEWTKNERKDLEKSLLE